MILIIPCFNEAERLKVDPFLAFAEESREVKLLFINDGSTANTADLIKAAEDKAPEQIFSLHLKKNQGKAEAVRHGVLQALERPCQYIGYWEPDLATPLSAIPQFMKCFAQDPERTLVCGARLKRMGAQISRHWYRHYPGRVIATIISMILGLPFYDTQCDAKIMERTLAEQICTKPFISPWLFDVELIARLESWTDIGDSKISLSYLPKVPYELLKIYRMYRHTRTRHHR